VYDHQPIYYDEVKERQKEREKKIKEELGMQSEDEQDRDYAARIRAGFRSGHKIKPHYEVTRSIKRKSNIMLIVILVILMLLAKYLVKSGEEWYMQFFAK
jgi:hypothetical protein